MSRQEQPVDVVLVGLGWTNAIMGMELAQEGLNVLALERGEDRDTVPDFAYPKMADELTYGVRYKLMVKPAKSTITVRHSLAETAVPYRHLGSFLPGDGVGGAGTHWNGHTWRPMPEELRLRSYVEQTFGKNIIPKDMTIQDYGVSYEELEPHFDFFDKVLGVSGKAGNINGKIQEGGNPFEGPRSHEYPLPPLKRTLNDTMFSDAAKAQGLHPFPLPSSNASEAYTNPYGMQLGPCNFCGFCERYGCINYSKASPQTAILGALKQHKNFAYRTGCEVIKVNLSDDKKTATGVTYIDAKGEEVFQPAKLVVVGTFAYNNVRLLLLSGIGQPYDPLSNTGTVGRNYAYQMMGGATLFFKDKQFNPFIGAGSNATTVDDFAINQIDFAKEGFIGGSYLLAAQTNGQPIHSLPLPPGTPTWGADWKKAAKDYYGHAMSISSHGSNMSYRDCYLSLDPNYKDDHGLPLLRLTFDWKENDLRMTQFMKQKVAALAKGLNPDFLKVSFKDIGTHYDVRPYQTTHNVGGAIMGTDPKTSVLNRYQQSWDVHNVFVLGSSSFPQNLQYNPTMLVGALAYWSAKAIREQYLKHPGPLVQA
ncbi:GMC family oxidoreductase [Shewanella dokdonensis]|uniref:GMC family oxidoreductase n=1 Tax=Shewanella dokdonensis TaxID=712036 RepID=A0ABX8DDH7_9GAMM|nr:GMC family oxidoreductase [Shewanella dokdonensis]MCL1073425.1 GMC family oxidoreductase [Shewanella dokdonensis]QVK22774.1 GMC family oxidoreductase [Shewanella dokdonensis]